MGTPLLLGVHGQGGTPEGWATDHIFDSLAGKHKWTTNRSYRLVIPNKRGVAADTPLLLGGMLIHHLLQELPGRFLGAAPIYALPLLGYLVGSSFQLVTQASKAKRTSLFSLFPRSDTTIPWEGGRDDDGWLYEPRDKALGVWAALHECELDPRDMPLPGNGTRLHEVCFQYASCLSGGKVQYCMYDGTHGDWPEQPGADLMVWSFFTSLLPSASAEIIF